MPEAQGTTSGSSGTYIDGVRQWTVSELQRLVGLHQEREARADLLLERLEADRDRLLATVGHEAHKFDSPSAAVDAAVAYIEEERARGTDAATEADRLRVALHQIACESHPDTMTAYSFGQALGRVHDIARRAVDPPKEKDGPDA